MNLFDKQIAISINGLFFLILVLILILAIVAVVFKLRQKNKMDNRVTSTSGFLGKSIYSLLGVVVVAAGLVFGILALNSQQVFNIEAKRTVTAEIYSNVLLTDGDYAYVSLKLTPSVEGDVWGQPGDKFDIYWSLVQKDGENFSYIENSKTEDDKSNLDKYFPLGDYEITVTVVFDGDSHTFTKQVSF
ncbi:MAG TPA: hypothetical protein PKU95_02960 [Candidatus Dojkabacteria bacterium]|jgi:uncharacterized membrane protein|nr:hypothetical protein [Candidatus Dojkabacteria bacterium]